MPASRPARIAVTVLRALLAALFLVAAGMKLLATEFEVHGFARFGYALWFMYLIGVLELAGGIGLIFTATAAPAAAAMAVIMVGALASHLNVGDGPAMFAPAAVALALCLAVAAATPWHRPQSLLRRLA